MHQAQPFLAALRSKDTDMAGFRRASHQLSLVLASETLTRLRLRRELIETPMGPTHARTRSKNVVLIPILRAGLGLLDGFLELIPGARIGMMGTKRDEETAEAHWYYENLPPISKTDHVILLDPMIATGGSALEAIDSLRKKGIREMQIIFVGVVASKQGLKRVQTAYPNVEFIVPAVDGKLNAQKFIVPGLGDFGDRYFGTIE